MIRVKIRLQGSAEIIRAFRRLPDDGKQELVKKSKELADQLARQAISNANALGRQDALAARSVRAEKTQKPTITAGRIGGRKSQGVLFGSEFGAKKRFGWYAKPRYKRSVRRQFRPHQGANSYWFFRTIDENQGEISRAYLGAAEEICRKWGAL